MDAAAATAREWFVVADADGDGTLSGGEAVAFFQRSGLPRPTLAQIWELSARGASSLDLPQFWTALQLVAVAQRDPASFSAASAAEALQRETLPLPRLEGLSAHSARPSQPNQPQQEQPQPQHQQQQQQQPQQHQQDQQQQQLQLPQHQHDQEQFQQQQSQQQPNNEQQHSFQQQPQHPQAQPQQHQEKYGQEAQQEAHQQSNFQQQQSFQTQSQFQQQAPHQQPQQQQQHQQTAIHMSNGGARASEGRGLPSSHAAAAGVGWPAMTPAEHQHYAATFAAVDKDRDGWVTGAECAPMLAQSGLPREQLKALWDVIAGERGALNGTEFLQAMYLIDCCKKGIPLPPSLPPAPFPPVQSGGGGGMGDGGGGVGAEAASYFVQGKKRSSVEVPEIPKLELLQESDGADPVTSSPPPPTLDDAKLRCLAGDQKQRLEAELNGASEAAAKLSRQEAEAATAQKKLAFYRAQMSRMTIAKSRVDTALMQAREKAKHHQTEADAMAMRYNGAVKALQTEHGEGMALMERGQRAARKRAEAASRLTDLQGEVAALSAQVPEMGGAGLEGLRREVEEAEAAAVAAELRAMSCAKQVELGNAKLSALGGLDDPQSSAAIAELAQKTNVLRQGLSADASAEEKDSTLRELVALHSTLGSYAASAGLFIPQLAAPVGSVTLKKVWVDGAPAGGAWCNFKDEGVRHVGAVADLSPPLLWDATNARAGPTTPSPPVASFPEADAFGSSGFDASWPADTAAPPSSYSGPPTNNAHTAANGAVDTFGGSNGWAAFDGSNGVGDGAAASPPPGGWESQAAGWEGVSAAPEAGAPTHDGGGAWAAWGSETDTATQGNSGSGFVDFANW